MVFLHFNIISPIIERIFLLYCHMTPALFPGFLKFGQGPPKNTQQERKKGARDPEILLLIK